MYIETNSVKIGYLQFEPKPKATKFNARRVCGVDTPFE
jgi:hypothetical protein